MLGNTATTYSPRSANMHKIITTPPCSSHYDTESSNRSFEDSIDVLPLAYDAEISQHRSTYLTEARRKSHVRASRVEKKKIRSSLSSATRRIYKQCSGGSSSGHDISTDISSIKARFLAGSTATIHKIERQASSRIPLKDMRSLIRERADEITRADKCVLDSNSNWLVTWNVSVSVKELCELKK